MKTFFKFSIVVLTTFIAALTPGRADIALEGYPNMHHTANGRYFRDPRPDGSTEYKAFRSDAIYTSQLIRYNLSAGRWELYLTRRSGGASELGAWSDITSSASVFASGWKVVYGSGIVTVTYPLKVYNAIEQYASCNSCAWSNPRTWSSGIVPRTYDNVTIDGNVLLDIPSKCNNLVLKTGTTSSPVRSLVGRATESKLRIYGNLFKGSGTLFDIVELEFAGNVVQTIETNDRSYFSILVSRVKINNPQDIQLRSTFGFERVSSTRSELTFIKGKIYLGDHDLTCENILDADETRFIITSGTGMLKFHMRRAGEAMLHRFPVGPSADRYTPILVLFATTNREFSGMRAKASYKPEIFLPDNHVNIIYTIDHGTTLPPAGALLTWIYQFQWDATDATSGFNPAFPAQVKRWNGAWSAAVSGGTVTGTGPHKHLFSTKSTGINNFGINNETKRPGVRVSAEENEIAEAHAELDFGIFPNPAISSGFSVTVANAETTNLRLQNLSGITVPINSYKSSENVLAVQPVLRLTPGIYFLQVNESDKISVHKVLVE